jgi:hypothetical protein
MGAIQGFCRNSRKARLAWWRRFPTIVPPPITSALVIYGDCRQLAPIRIGLALSRTLRQCPASNGDASNVIRADGRWRRLRPLAAIGNSFGAWQPWRRVPQNGCPAASAASAPGPAPARRLPRGRCHVVPFNDAVFAGVHRRARPVPWSARSLSRSATISFGKNQGTGQPAARPVPWSETSILVRDLGVG